MVEQKTNQSARARWSTHRALSTPMAAVVMLVVIVVVGALGYVAFNAVKTNPKNTTSCAPAASPACAGFSNLHDVMLAAPFKAIQQGNLVPFTASLPAGETGTAYMFNFGDGSTIASQASPTLPHTYASAGTYIASVTATVGGVTHDSDKSLVVITVAASYAAASAGNTPGVAGRIVSNTTTTSGGTALIGPGGSVTVAGSYTSAPTNPLFVLHSPTITASPGVTLGTTTTTNSSATVKATFSTQGIYWVTFVGQAANGAVIAYQNYTWTVFVAPTGVQPGTQGGKIVASPHKGSLDVYEFYPGGSTSEDPAVDYETVGYEPILNVYQTLIQYNGSQTGPTWTSYVPEIATCIPGSPVCSTLYGSSLINGNNYTFVIGGDSQFYDPATSKSWGVYPTDVLFSVARTMGFAVQPCVGCNNGWILTQSLLSPGNGAWDGGIHGGLNNTPGNVYAAVTLNGTDCPISKLAPTDHGCVTFNAGAAGHAWPYFLELIADPLGGSIVPCGWFSAPAQGAGIPDWTVVNGQSVITGAGDHPCGAPGSAGYGSAPASTPIKAWDSWESAGSIPPFVGNVQWGMLGSGPYYMKAFSPGTAYTLQANPAYHANSHCAYAGCQPAAGQYAGTVSVTWTTSQVPGEQAYAAGSADFASIPSTDTALLLQLIQQGKVLATSFPSISIFFFPFDFSFNAQGTQKFTSNPVTVPGDWFSYVGMRQFFSHAYPYQTIQQTINTKDGIQYLFNYGGAIPQFMANYYPTNVSFPSSDPCSDKTNPTCAAYWWDQVQTVASPYYDKEVAACVPANPCQFPLFGQTGSPDLDQRLALWAGSINTLTGGAIRVTPVDINFNELVVNSLFSPPYANPMPVFQLGWAPDYPDPTDYMVPLYQTNGSYTYGDAVWQQTNLAQFNASTCHPFTAYSWYAANGVANNCQGAAYGAMQLAMKIAAVTPAGPARVLLYIEIEQIANAMSLYTYWGQQNLVASSAAWIDPTTLNSNVTTGGGGDNTWYTITGNGVF